MNAAISLFIVLFFMNEVTDSFKNFLIAFLWGFSISFTQWAGLSGINAWLDKRFSWLDNPVKKLLLKLLPFFPIRPVLLLWFSFLIFTRGGEYYPQNHGHGLLNHCPTPS